MTTGRWIALWQGIFLAGTALFAALTVWVAVRGGRDVRDLLRFLARRR